MNSPVNIFMVGFTVLAVISFIRAIKSQDKYIYKNEPAPFNAWFGVFVLSLFLSLMCVIIKLYAY